LLPGIIANVIVSISEIFLVPTAEACLTNIDSKEVGK
jgi:hypothetical protein